MKNLSMWWVLPAFILLWWLGLRGLDADTFSHDEVRSLIVTGGAHHGPAPWPIEIVRRIEVGSPEQAFGYFLVLAPWGALAGWTEFASRSLSLLVALTALAMTFRIGDSLFGRGAGLSAVLILASSAYFVSFAHKLRAFTFVALAVTLTVWCYWRVVYGRRGWASQIGLALGGVGLVWTHYFGALLLLPIGLYHVFVAPKHRWWWRPVMLFVPVALSFLPQAGVFMSGLENSSANESLQARALSPGGVLAITVRYFGNGYDTFFWMLMILGGLALLLKRSQRREGIYVLFLAVGMLATLVAANAFVGVFTADRVRYLMPLWPLLGLIGGVGVATVGRWQPATALLILGVWMMLGVPMSLSGDLMRTEEGDERAKLPWREMIAEVRTQGQPGDLLLYHGFHSNVHGHYTHGLDFPRIIMQPIDEEATMRGYLQDVRRVWYTADLRMHIAHQFDTFQAVLRDEAFIHCETLMQEPLMHLDLYVRYASYCPTDANIATFGADVHLAATEPLTVSDGVLAVRTGWRIGVSVPSQALSVSFQVLSADGALVSQADVPLPRGPYGPLDVTLTDLPDDDGLMLHAVVYNWQTGERLPTASGDSALLGAVTR